MNTSDDYDYDRVDKEFQLRTRTRDHGWKRGLALGIVLGVLLSTGTTYAIYVGEIAYETRMQFQYPSASQGERNISRVDADADNAETEQTDNRFTRHHRGWGNSRRVHATEE